VIILEKLERDLIHQLKDCFLQLFDGEFDVLHFENFISETLYIILKIFHVENAAVYKYQDWKQQFELISLARMDGEDDMTPGSIPFWDINDLFNQDGFMLKSQLPGQLENYDVLIKINKKDQLLGFIVIKDPKGSMIHNFTEEGFRKIGEDYGVYWSKVQNITRIISEEKKYKQLFRVTEKFHSSMNMDNLLGEIIITLQEVYPSFSYYLLLSQGNHTHSELLIRDLEYDNENITAMEAYVTGTVRFEENPQQRGSTLYAPLKGKQGVYGVLVVNAPNTFVFPRNEVEFITLLANTAGSAIENAQLYQQSRKLISDLQLINETSHRLNSSLRLSETIQYMSNQIIKSFDAEEVGFFLYSSKEAVEKILPGSTTFFSTEQAVNYLMYVKEKIQMDNEPLFIGDFCFPEEMGPAKYRSMMVIPMDLGDHLKGIAIVMHQKPYFFSFDIFKLLQSLIHHSTLAFTNSMLREELEKMIITDHLTKLNSRTFLDEKIQRSMKDDEQGTFILIDIDDFKKVNDTFGHQVGDEVLIQVADLIKSNIREGDIGARWGGEELAIYLPRISLKAGVAIAERLVEKVSEDSNPHVTVSCGVSFWHKEQFDTYNKLFKRADEALYIAKRTGKNKVITQEENLKVC
jgi:diguanylate cyclase (GGDEF)-like protein